MTHRNDLVPCDAEAITPSDTSSKSYCGFYVGVGGDVKVTTKKGNPVTFTDLPAGTIMPLGIIRVWAAGTTATNLVGFIA
jgi:hypothetical protein